ncbi:hypothetical protein [Streptomyces sp. NPDC001492]
MATTPETEATAPVDASYADGVLAGRAMSSAVFLAGLIANGQLETAGRPDKLPADLFPHVDPDVVQAIWDRALAVGLHAGRVSASPRLYRDQMARVQAEFERVGYEAMARMVGRSRRLVAPHPADGETARARELRCDKRTNDTGEGS